MGLSHSYSNINKNNALPLHILSNVSQFIVTISEATIDPLYGPSIPILATFKINLPSGSSIVINKPYAPGVSHNFGVIDDVWLYESGPSHYIYYEVLVKYENGWLESSGAYPDVYLFQPLNVIDINISRNLLDSAKADFLMNFETDPILISGNNLNVLKYQRQYYDGASYVNIDSSPVTVSSFVLNDVIEHSLPYAEDASYKVKVIIFDLLSYFEIVDTLSTTSVPISWGPEGIGVGKIYEEYGGVKPKLDLARPFTFDGIIQPVLFRKKPTDPDPEGMEDGDLLFIYHDLVAFTSNNFPLEFGESFIWGHSNTSGVWYTEFNYWTSLGSSNNTMIESFEASTLKGDNTPSIMFVNDSNCYFIPDTSLPGVILLKFKGKVKFNYFNLSGWNQDHEPKNSPKSFAFFGSNDGHKWDLIYDTSAFADTYKTTVRQAISNANYYEYLKLVFRTNQDNNSGNVANATMIAINKLSFEVEGFKYV